MIRVWTAALAGVTGIPVEVEVRISSQLPRVDVVGLPEAAVRESVSRIRGAIAAVGRTFPDRRVTVNLAPAELRKSGAGLDLPIAIGILAAAGDLDPERLAGRAFLGELALDGRLRPSRGTLAAVLAVRSAGAREAIVPAASVARASLAPDVLVLGATDLEAVLGHLLGDAPLPVVRPGPRRVAPRPAACLSEIRGQAPAKRALEIAAAGGHGLLLTGPPGTGKTLLARRLPDLLPPLDGDAELEALCVQDAAGGSIDDDARGSVDHDARDDAHDEAGASLEDPAGGGRRATTRPFRAPHHSASAAGLLGGGQPVRPGEVSLAHHGVLFLDELPEFDRRCLESLREVLEQGVVRIARAGRTCVLPARFQLVAAANPCPCGHYGVPDHDCRCDDASLDRYRRRLSGPLLDRIDLHVAVGEVPWAVLRGPADGPTTDVVRQRVARARARQRERGHDTNAGIPDAALEGIVRAEEGALELLGRAVERWRLSARATRRTLRVARTVADLAGAETTGPEAMAEAIGLRSPE